jgi:hypothetical protein
MTVRNFISIQLDVIDQIDVRNTDGSGAGVAAIAGAVLGAAFWGGMANDPDSGGTKGIIPVLAGAGIGAGIGMFIGFVASPGTHEWKRVWRSN